jgi:hypothetical protein
MQCKCIFAEAARPKVAHRMTKTIEVGKFISSGYAYQAEEQGYQNLLSSVLREWGRPTESKYQ